MTSQLPSLAALELEALADALADAIEAGRAPA